MVRTAPSLVRTFQSRTRNRRGARRRGEARVLVAAVEGGGASTDTVTPFASCRPTGRAAASIQSVRRIKRKWGSGRGCRPDRDRKRYWPPRNWTRRSTVVNPPAARLVAAVTAFALVAGLAGWVGGGRRGKPPASVTIGLLAGADAVHGGELAIEVVNNQYRDL